MAATSPQRKGEHSSSESAEPVHQSEAAAPDDSAPPTYAARASTPTWTVTDDARAHSSDDDDGALGNEGENESEYDEEEYEDENKDENVDHDDWDNYVLDAILRRRGTQYLCKWRSLVEPEWCERSELEENGYVKQLEAFDLDRTPKRPKAPSQALRDEDSLAAVLPGQLALELGGTASIATGPIRTALESSGFQLLRYAEFKNHKLEKKFIHTWKRDPQYEPRLCYFPASREFMFHVQAKGVTDNPASVARRVPPNKILVSSQPAEALERSELQRFVVACLALIGPRFLGELFSDSMLTAQGWVELPKTLCDGSNPDVLILIPMWLVQVVATSSGGAASGPTRPLVADVMDVYRTHEPELVDFTALAQLAVAGKTVPAHRK